MKLFDDLLSSVAGSDCPIKRVAVGLHWTVVESRYVGMAHTFRTGWKVEPDSAGNLIGSSTLSLASRIQHWEMLETGLGLAALNSLIEPTGRVGNIYEHLCGLAAGKTVTVIGRFPANDQIKRAAAKAYFLEIDPQEGELPAGACEQVIPQSDWVIISATAIINKTLPRLLELSSNAISVVLGPSTPLNDVLFQHGARIAAGVRTVDPDALFESVIQGVKRFKNLAGIEPVFRQTERLPALISRSNVLHKGV